MKSIWGALLLAAMPVQAADLSAVDSYVSAYLAEASYPGVAVAITKGDQVIAVRGYGHDSAGEPMTGNSKMAVASVSKSFTALAVTQLAEAGKIDLDRPVFDSRITARQLLGHTSGISDRTLPEKSLPQPDTTAEAVERAREALRTAEPGTARHYTNTNYHLAARLVELASGQRFNDYLREHIFEPAGMRDTVAIDVTPRDLPADHRRGYSYAYGFPVAATEPHRFVAGSDGVITTAADMARWLAWQKSPAPEDGQGWETDEQGRLRHSGIWFTGTAGQVLTPSGYGVAVMANSGITLGNEGTYAVENGIIDILEGRTPESPSSARLLIDLVLAALTVLSLVLGIRALRRPRKWHKAWQVLRLVPLGTLLASPMLLGLLYGGGRDVSFYQLAHYSLPLVVWLGVSSVMNLSVAVVRMKR